MTAVRRSHLENSAGAILSFNGRTKAIEPAHHPSVVRALVRRK
jgi:hypothetical protein